MQIILAPRENCDHWDVSTQRTLRRRLVVGSVSALGIFLLVVEFMFLIRLGS